MPISTANFLNFSIKWFLTTLVHYYFYDKLQILNVITIKQLQQADICVVICRAGRYSSTRVHVLVTKLMCTRGTQKYTVNVLEHEVTE